LADADWAAQVVLMQERYRRWEAEVAIYHESQAGGCPTNHGVQAT
jgi:hypothetical protein